MTAADRPQSVAAGRERSRRQTAAASVLPPPTAGGSPVLMAAPVCESGVRDEG